MLIGPTWANTGYHHTPYVNRVPIKSLRTVKEYMSAPIEYVTVVQIEMDCTLIDVVLHVIIRNSVH